MDKETKREMIALLDRKFVEARDGDLSVVVSVNQQDAGRDVVHFLEDLGALKSTGLYGTEWLLTVIVKI